MKILTLHQPDASLIASGAKRIVTRTFGTDYRGPVAIHAARSFPRESMQIAAGETFLRALCAAGIEHFEDIPRGVIVAVAELRACYRIAAMESTLLTPAKGEPGWGEVAEKWGLDLVIDFTADNDLDVPFCVRVDSREKEYGDFKRGRYAWMLSEVRALPAPIECKGAATMKPVSIAVLEEIRAQLEGVTT